MDSLFFKCTCCNKDIRMTKSAKDHFAEWAYYDGIEWSDFNDVIPDFSEKHWVRSVTTPIVGERHILHVSMPFDESIGDEFWSLFEPALIYFNGWSREYDSDIEKCAIIRCKLTNILKRTEYEAWVTVNVQKVVLASELCHYFEPYFTNQNINLFDGIPESEYQTLYDNNNWLVTCWDAQGDCGENKWIYTDENGTAHLVMQSSYDFDHSILYIGNVIHGDK